MSNALHKTSDALGEISQRIQNWNQLGVSSQAATAFALSGANTREDVIALGPKFFKARANCGTKTHFEISKYAGFPLEDQTCASILAETFGPNLAKPQRAKAISKKTIFALRRFGYVTTVAPRKS